MSLRFWGGWFLAIAGISIFLTMGCEKGALGVKPATVVGRVVDKDNPSLAVVNATVRMISKEAVGTSELLQGYNFLSAVTGVDGSFIFEQVQPDNVVFEYSAPGYASMIYPAPTSTDAAEGTTASIEFVSIRSGAMVDLALLSLAKISNPLPATVKVKVDLVDKTTLQPIDKNRYNQALSFTISFNGKPYTLTAQKWREDGVADVAAANTIITSIRNEVTGGSAVYKAVDNLSFTGSSDVFQRIELDPVTYDISLRCLNVPDYMTGSGSVVNIFAEIPATTSKPAQIIKSAIMQPFGELYVLSLPGIALPVDLRIQLRGYEDEVVKITDNNLTEGTQGNYRLDIDFLASNSARGNVSSPYNPAQAVGLYDNMKRRDVALAVSGLLNGNSVTAMINLPHLGLPEYESGGVATNVCYQGETVWATFAGVAVGYNMSYTVNVTTATSSYSISKAGLMVNPESDTGSSTLVYGVP